MKICLNRDKRTAVELYNRVIPSISMFNPLQTLALNFIIFPHINSLFQVTHKEFELLLTFSSVDVVFTEL